MFDNTMFDDTAGSSLFGFDRGDWVLLVGGCVLSTCLTLFI